MTEQLDVAEQAARVVAAKLGNGISACRAWVANIDQSKQQEIIAALEQPDGRATVLRVLGDQCGKLPVLPAGETTSDS